MTIRQTICSAALLLLSAATAEAAGGHRTLNVSTAVKARTVALKPGERMITVRVPKDLRIITQTRRGSWEHGASSNGSGIAAGNSKRGGRLYRVQASGSGERYVVVPKARIENVPSGDRINWAGTKSFTVK